MGGKKEKNLNRIWGGSGGSNIRRSQMNVLLTMVVLVLAPPRRIQQQENGWKVENQHYWEFIHLGKCVCCCIRRA